MNEAFKHLMNSMAHLYVTRQGTSLKDQTMIEKAKWMQSRSDLIQLVIEYTKDPLTIEPTPEGFDGWINWRLDFDEYKQYLLNEVKFWISIYERYPDKFPEYNPKDPNIVVFKENKENA